MPHDPDRQSLADQQARLVAALTAGAAPPAAFDPAQLSAAVRSLYRKRARAVAKTWPALAASLGDRFDDLFAAYAIAHPLPVDGALADGHVFADHLRRANELPDPARVELLLHQTTRGWPIRLARLRDAHRLALALRLPTGRVLHTRIPFV
jgi:hypothetical protein